MYRMRYGGYRRAGFAWPWLLFGFLFLVVFGKFLWPLLLILFFAVPFFFWMKGARRWRGDWGQWGDWSKRKNDEYDEKPKRRYTQTPDGEWVEIV